MFDRLNKLMNDRFANRGYHDLLGVAVNMLEKLNKLMNNQFANDGWGYRAHTTIIEVDEETGEQYEECGVAVEVAIADLFHANGYTDENFSVVQNTWSTSPATDEGFVSVAWCENGKLYHEVYELYN